MSSSNSYKKQHNNGIEATELKIVPKPSSGADPQKNKQNQKPTNQLDRYGTKDLESRPHQSYFRRNLWLREWQRCAISDDNLQLQQRWRWWWICLHLGSRFFREITPQPVDEFSTAMKILTDNTGDDTYLLETNKTGAKLEFQKKKILDSLKFSLS